MLPALLSLCSILLLCGWSLPLCQRWLAAEPPALRLPISFGLSVGGATLLFAALGFSGLSAALVWVVLLLLTVGGVLLGAWPQLAVAAHFTQWLRRLRTAQPAPLAQLILLLAGAAALSAKDTRLALELGEEMGVPMAAGALARQTLEEVLARGWGGDDSDSIIRLQEERAGVQLRLPE